MNSFKVLLSIIGLLLVTTISIDVSANKSMYSSRCPIEMIFAIMASHSKMLRSLLLNGEDPNASLNNCRIVINQEGNTTLSNEDESINIVFNTKLNKDTLKSYSLLHLAAKVRSAGLRDIDSPIYYRKTEICVLLVEFGADIYATDATYQTPMDIEIESQGIY